MALRRSCKPETMGSIPIIGLCGCGRTAMQWIADPSKQVQLLPSAYASEAEKALRLLGKQEMAGSIPVTGFSR
jgi:hypothetical protein